MYLVPNRTIDVMSVTSNLPMDDAPEWSNATTYGVGDTVQRARRVFVSTVADNFGTDPAFVDQSDEAPVWLVNGYINAVRPFDGVLSNKLTANRGAEISAEYVAFGVDPDLTAVVLDFAVIPSENIITLFGLDASRVRVIGISDANIVVYNDVRVTSGRWVANALEYFTLQLSGWKRIQVFENLPLSCARVLICLEGLQVSLAEVTIGKGLYIGRALVNGTGAEHRSASFFDVNQFGTVTFTQRATRRDVTYSVDLSRQHFEQIEGLIADMTGGLVTGIGNVNRPTNISCGIMGEITWDESQPDAYQIKFTVKGVT